VQEQENRWPFVLLEESVQFLVDVAAFPSRSMTNKRRHFTIINSIVACGEMALIPEVRTFAIESPFCEDPAFEEEEEGRITKTNTDEGI
jgi:hypothetical protein